MGREAVSAKPVGRLESVVVERSRDFIWEMLKSHSWLLLIEFMQKKKSMCLTHKECRAPQILTPPRKGCKVLASCHEWWVCQLKKPIDWWRIPIMNDIWVNRDLLFRASVWLLQLLNLVERVLTFWSPLTCWENRVYCPWKGWSRRMPIKLHRWCGLADTIFQVLWFRS